MTIRTRVEGVNSLRGKLRRLPVEGRKGVTDAVAKSALAVKSDAQRSIERGPKTGRVYTTYFYTDAQGRLRKVGRRGKPHQASAPGEAPALDLGGLVDSIFDEISENGLAAEVGTDLDYGTYLEFGTRKMAARPWLQPAFERNKEKIKARVRNAIKKATQRARRR